MSAPQRFRGFNEASLFWQHPILPAHTLQRLMVLADEICFLDRPSVMPIGQWGTIGHDNPMRQLSTGSETIKISASKPPNNSEAGGLYEYYASADVLNPDFVRVLLDGIRNSEDFAYKYLQPAANYGNGVTGTQLRQLLVADKTLYQVPFDLATKQHPAIMYQTETAEGRKAVTQTLLVDASIRITSALLMADELDALPIAGDNIHPQLLALRVTNPKYVGGTPSLAPFLGLQFVRAVNHFSRGGRMREVTVGLGSTDGAVAPQGRRRRRSLAAQSVAEPTGWPPYQRD
jgi:hypothetical protein